MSLVLAATEAERLRAAARVRENIRRVQAMSEQDLVAVLDEMKATRDRFVAQLATGSEFDQAYARRLIADVDREMERLKRKIQPRLASAFRRIMEAGDSDTLEVLRQIAEGNVLSTPGLDTTLVSFAQANSADLVQQIGEEARTRINTALRRGATGTSTPSDVARDIGSVVRQAGRDPGVFGKIATQTERIFRTETQRLYSGATEARMERVERDTGRRVTKTWVHLSGRIPGAQARSDHAMLNGTTIPRDEHFNVAAGPRWSRVSFEEAQRQGGTLGFKASGPQDSVLPAGQVVNCRCGLAPGIEEPE